MILHASCPWVRFEHAQALEEAVGRCRGAPAHVGPTSGCCQGSSTNAADGFRALDLKLMVTLTTIHLTVLRVNPPAPEATSPFLAPSYL